ncbi:MAG TPA: carboxypeptidase-like regulatory domain-containing protein, partial [Rhodothermales bacterium]|nr:carboxypeptidase-like regulatory domain-containing protein [Rhodothermales bacterium]
MKSQSILPRSIFTVLMILTLFCTLPLQAQTSGGTLMGRVVDSGGGDLPGVTVTATNDATGVSRSTVSSSDGTYRFALLPAGTYSVTGGLEGFGAVTIQQVTLNIATTRTLDITLQPAAVRDSIIVTADAPLISTSPAIGTVVSQQELENLPLNGRQFANLASLAPGTSLGVNPDPTKPGQLVVALNGGIGRNVNYTIDGGDNTDDTIGGALQNYNLEAVQEFKIQTQQYKAEFGRSTGGVLSVVTKTGTNNLSGSIYGFFRDESLNSRTETERRLSRDKQPYERQQYGLSIGGPFVRDKAHYFLTFENTDRDTQFAVNTRGVFPQLDGQSFPIPYEDVLVTGKMTLDLTPSQFLQVRGGYQKYSD